MTPVTALSSICAHARLGGHLTLFLDYDGTLADINSVAPLPNPALIEVISGLLAVPSIHPIVLSGRPLESLRVLLPLPRLILAGVYGIEIQQADGSVVSRVASDKIKPVIAQVAREWGRLTGGRPGFLVEDKGYAVVLHSENAPPAQADALEQAALEVAQSLINPATCRIIQGPRFLEVASVAANKGLAVEWFLQAEQAPDNKLVFFGDDENDDAAFAVIQQRGGLTVGVGRRFTLPHATILIDSPAQVHEWLRTILEAAQPLA